MFGVADLLKSVLQTAGSETANHLDKRLKKRPVSMVVGGGAGAYGGAQAGMLLGSVIAPGPGTAIGGIIGGIAGALAGTELTISAVDDTKQAAKNMFDSVTGNVNEDD